MRDAVRLDVPAITQKRESLSGSTSIEMIFRYWGEDRYSQLDIARALVWKFRDNRRFYKSHTLFQIRSGKTADDMDWSSYPGSGTGYIREFLEPIAPTENPRTKNLPSHPEMARKLQEERFQKIKESINQGIPVIVFQWVDGNRKEQTFRVVTGFNPSAGVVYLNDPATGAMQMKDSEFLYLWKVDETWLPFNAIIFNQFGSEQIKKGSLRVTLDGPEA